MTYEHTGPSTHEHGHTDEPRYYSTRDAGRYARSANRLNKPWRCSCGKLHPAEQLVCEEAT